MIGQHGHSSGACITQWLLRVGRLVCLPLPASACLCLGPITHPRERFLAGDKKLSDVARAGDGEMRPQEATGKNAIQVSSWQLALAHLSRCDARRMTCRIG